MGYQITLIGLGGLVALLLLYFIWKEVFPQYKEYQNTYVALEEFRSTYTGNPPPAFTKGIKQIVIPDPEHGPEEIDRCISCHVALKFDHFSPTKVAKDINGKVIYTENGTPLLVENENYVWKRLHDTIADLRDEKVNTKLEAEGKHSEVKKRLNKALELEELKSGTFDDIPVNMERVIAMHPLMGSETTPFELHPMEEYGCTICHNGNGRGLTLKTAHGPIYDDLYEAAHMGPHPKFTEIDEENDPAFSKVFNHKPGHDLLFQTTPVFVGSLMQSACVQCHRSTSNELQGVVEAADSLADRKKNQVDIIRKGFDSEVSAVIATVQLREWIQTKGYENSKQVFLESLSNYKLPPEALDQIYSRMKYLEHISSQSQETGDKLSEKIDSTLHQLLEDSLGSETNITILSKQLALHPREPELLVKDFVTRKNQSEKGSLFVKAQALKNAEAAQNRLSNATEPLNFLINDKSFKNQYITDAQRMIGGYDRGQNLFMQNACYACHSIEGLSRGGVGPELTNIGNSYPWYIKESIVYPQADLKTSTMPNFKLDHEELEHLMTFLLAQRGGDLLQTDVQRSVAIKAWQAGKKLPWEEPIPPTDILDLNASMKTFALEGCAACHKLMGFESNTGFISETQNNKDELYQDREWFYETFPEQIHGSQLVSLIEKYQDTIENKISNTVRENSILEEINIESPGTIEGFYTNFKFAMRAKNSEYSERLAQAKNNEEAVKVEAEFLRWKSSVQKVLQIYIQQYGLGRDIAPRLNWSGVYRDNAWLYGHFKKPEAYIPRSIMPIMPFDDSKFYGLIYMLHELGAKNRDRIQEIWDTQGFSPELAYTLYCSSCHGTSRHGNGPVAQWIYPIPKNLRDSTFMHNLTKEKAIESLIHGVPGTPMPPWGKSIPKSELKENSPVMTEQQIEELVDWLYSQLKVKEVFKENEVLKWKYTPADVLKEIEEGRETLPSLPEESQKNTTELDPSQYKGASAANFSLSSTLYEGVKIEPAFLKDNKETRVSAASMGQSSPVSINQYMEEKVDEYDGKKYTRYYIKPIYYTSVNIVKGEHLFIMNCSHCHGKEGAGNGLRAEAMVDAKPRILTNTNWLSQRDDLRLLRSIKYGVPGTSMTPWGDKVNIIQSMQIVMFIRQKAYENQWQQKFTDKLFTVFNTSEMNLDRVRAFYYTKMKSAQEQYENSVNAKANLYEKLKEGKVNAQDAAAAYEKELELLKKVQYFQELDKYLKTLIDLVLQEKQCYQSIGKTLASRGLDRTTLTYFINLVSLNEGQYTFNDKILERLENPQVSERNYLTKLILEGIDVKLKQLSKEVEQVKNQMISAQRAESLDVLNESVLMLTNAKSTLVLQLERASQLNEEQEKIYQKLKEITMALWGEVDFTFLGETLPSQHPEVRI